MASVDPLAEYLRIPEFEIKNQRTYLDIPTNELQRSAEIKQELRSLVPVLRQKWAQVRPDFQQFINVVGPSRVNLAKVRAKIAEIEKKKRCTMNRIQTRLNKLARMQEIAQQKLSKVGRTKKWASFVTESLRSGVLDPQLFDQMLIAYRRLVTRLGDIGEQITPDIQFVTAPKAGASTQAIPPSCGARRRPKGTGLPRVRKGTGPVQYRPVYGTSPRFQTAVGPRWRDVQVPVYGSALRRNPLFTTDPEPSGRTKWQLVSRQAPAAQYAPDSPPPFPPRATYGAAFAPEDVSEASFDPEAGRPIPAAVKARLAKQFKDFQRSQAASQVGAKAASAVGSVGRDVSARRGRSVTRRAASRSAMLSSSRTAGSTSSTLPLTPGNQAIDEYVRVFQQWWTDKDVQKMYRDTRYKDKDIRTNFFQDLVSSDGLSEETRNWFHKLGRTAFDIDFAQFLVLTDGREDMLDRRTGGRASPVVTLAYETTEVEDALNQLNFIHDVLWRRSMSVDVGNTPLS